MKTSSLKYKCSYTSGDGTEYQDGIWERKNMPKTIKMTKIEEYGVGVYANHGVGEKIKVGHGTCNPLREYSDGTFIIYFQQGGTPFYFQPIDKK